MRRLTTTKDTKSTKEKKKSSTRLRALRVLRGKINPPTISKYVYSNVTAACIHGNQMTDESKQPPLIRPISAPIDVPVFNVLIYVKHADGKVLARVANLPDFEFSASSEPTVLKQAITAVKAQLAKWHGDGETIPWVEPVPTLEDGEQERHVPVHL